MEQNGRFSNGFILGLIIGGGVVFLLGTKTGKKLLKTFSEEGMEGLTDLLEEAELEEEPEDEQFNEEEIVHAVNHDHATGEFHEDHPIDDVKETSEEKKETKKRFFKKK